MDTASPQHPDSAPTIETPKAPKKPLHDGFDAFGVSAEINRRRQTDRLKDHMGFFSGGSLYG